MFRTQLLPSSLLVSLLLSILSTPSFAAKSELEEGGWDAIPPEELAVTEPRIDKDAHAEFLYRSLYINDDTDNTLFQYHNRAKIFTEAGVQKWDKIDLNYTTGWRVYKIKARVIYPDGTVSHLDRKDIYSRKIYKDENFEGNAKSFSFPGLKPGCIVEYKWISSRAYWQPSLYMPLAAEWPTWHYDVTVRPHKGPASITKRFNTNANWEKKGGKFTLEVKDQFALSDKPFLAPRKDFEPWVFLEYGSKLDQLRGEDYWGYRGGALVEINKDFIRSKQKVIKTLGEELFNGLNSREDKLKAAYKYCTEEITNVSFYTNKFTEEELEDLKENSSPFGTIRNGYGTRYDINAVFASLCGLLDVSPALVMVEDQREISFHKSHTGAYNLSDWVVTIADGTERRYFDPGSSFLPFEALNAHNAGSNAIYTDKKYYYWVKTPEANESDTRTTRIANVSIDEYGDLKGSVFIKYSGYASIRRKRLFVSLTPEEREEYILENEWQSRLPRAKIENLFIKNDDNREEFLIVKYDVEIPAYADLIADRAIFNPSLFEVGKKPLFVEEERHEPIGFSFKYTNQDKVTIIVPEGFKPESVNHLAMDVDNAVATRKSMLTATPDSSELVYQRLYATKMTRLNPDYYPQIKQLFESLNQADDQSVSLVNASGLANADQ